MTMEENGDVIGEVGVLCYIPQPFAVRARRLSQLLRLDRAKFLSVVQTNLADGQKVIENMTQVNLLSMTEFSLCGRDACVCLQLLFRV